MSSWTDWFGRRRERAAHEALRLWRAHSSPDLGAAPAEANWAVVDCETSGLNPATDRLLSIAAVRVVHGRIEIGNSFHRLLRQSAPSSPDNILVHGIGGRLQMNGDDPRVVMTDFACFVMRDPIVAFHADFDSAFLRRTQQQTLGGAVNHQWLDIARLLPVIRPGGGRSAWSLDQWLDHFHISSARRHDALEDAYSTAALLLIALAEASRQGVDSAKALLKLSRRSRFLAPHT